jgi:hypothetical protein
MKKITDFPSYKNRQTLLLDLKEQERKAIREAEGCESAQGNVTVSERDRDAMTIRAGRDLPTHTENGPAEQAWRKVRALERAIELERVALSQERTAVSEKICAEERPKYEAILRRQAAAVEKLVEAHKAESAFREEMQLGDVSFTHHIPPCGFVGLQDIPDDAARWFAELKTYGYKV